MKQNFKKCLIMSILCILTLCGCSAKEKEQCKEQVTDFLVAYQTQDTTCGKYLSGNEKESTVKFERFQAVLAKPIKFEVKSVKVNKDYNVVEVDIENVDFQAVFEEMVNSKEIQVDIADELEKRLQAEDAPMRKFEVEIKLDKECKIEMTSELSNALLGGYTQYIYELTEEALQ